MTVTSFVPSGNMASTWTIFIISGTPVHYVLALQDRRAVFHQVGQHGDAALAGAFEKLVADQRDRLGVVQLDAAIETPPRHLGGGPNLDPFFFPYSEMHEPPLPLARDTFGDRVSARPRVIDAPMDGRREGIPRGVWRESPSRARALAAASRALRMVGGARFA